MHIQLPIYLIHKTQSDTFKIDRSLRNSTAGPDEVSSYDTNRMSDTDLAEIRALAVENKLTKYVRVMDSIIAMRDGSTDYKVPSFAAFPALLTAYLQKNFIDGWIYEAGEDGEMRAWAIVKVTLDSGKGGYRNRDTPCVKLKCAAYGRNSNGLSNISRTWSFEPGDVSRRHVSKILSNAGLLCETHELKAAYRQSDEIFGHILSTGFARQYRVTGAFINPGHGGRDPMEPLGHRVIMDLDHSRVKAFSEEVETAAFDIAGEGRFIDLPRHHDVLVYDLASHEDFWISTNNIETYVYRPELKNKMILPKEQADLLDILSTDTDLLTGDIVEGKAAGNIILCKGKPGVGKTLTAEIYSEVCEKPLYSVHAGVLGTTASTIAKNLREVLQRAQRWDCILLIDEADVFVAERGTNVEQNAIVAEFLRTLESFRSLMFMTTNRPNDIDDAIVSRCAAVIAYALPDSTLRAQIWKVMSDNFEADLSDELIAELVEAFNMISARDIKMLLRLTMRVSIAKEEPLSRDIFRKCAIFRGIPIEEKAA